MSYEIIKNQQILLKQQQIIGSIKLINLLQKINNKKMFLPNIQAELLLSLDASKTPLFQAKGQMKDDMIIETQTQFQGITAKTQCQIQIDKYQNIVIANSGKSLTQMGLLEECLTFQQMKYGLLYFISNVTMAPLGIQMGLCLPKICNVTEVQKMANDKFIELKRPIITKFVESPQLFEADYNAAYYISIVLLSLFAAALIISTVFSKLSKKSHVLGAFSLRKSMHIFQYKEHKFNVFNGVKAICMMWVIVGHMYSVRIQNNVNQLTITDQVQVPIFLVFLAAFFAVDVFFYIGGFLVAYSFLRNSIKSIAKYPLAIVHRVLRFWPSYIMAMVIYYGIMMHTGSGPLWPNLMTYGQIENCKTLWKPIIFVDNIVDNGEKMCMGWGWYLQNDMQIFILSIPILFLYSRNRKASFILIQVLILLSLIYNFVEVQVNQYITVTHRVDFAKWNSYFPNVYIKPWTRCPPYFYGLTLGLLYMQFIEQQKHKKDTKGFFSIVKAKFEANRLLKNIIQVLGLAIILFIVFIPRTLQAGHKWPQVVHSFYLTFTKLFFVMGVSMMVTPALLGIKNDFVFFLMDTKLANFIAKISFWTYLIHFMVIEHACYSQKIDFYYNVGDIFTIYFPVAIIAMAYGFVGTVLVQVPFAKLQKMLFEGKKKDKKGQQDPKVQTLLNASVVSGNSLSSSINSISTSIGGSLGSSVSSKGQLNGSTVSVEDKTS